MRPRGRPPFDAARGKTRRLTICLPELLCRALEKRGKPLPEAARQVLTERLEAEAAGRIRADLGAKQPPAQDDIDLFPVCTVCAGEGKASTADGPDLRARVWATREAPCISCGGCGRALPP